MGSQPVEQQVSAAQLDAIVRETTALVEAQKRSRRVRIALVLGVVIFVAAIGVLVVTKVNQLTSRDYLDKVADAAMKQLEKGNQEYMTHLEKLMSKVGPSVEEAFSERAKKDMPLFAKALDKEIDPLIKGIEVGFESRLNKKYESLKPTYERLLKEEFPQSKNKAVHEQVVGNVHIAVNNVLKDYYVNELERELDALKLAWETFPPARRPGPREDPLADQFLQSLFTLLQYRLAPLR